MYLQNGGTLEHAQQIAAHESRRTTKLYDRTQNEISLDEVERIRMDRRADYEQRRCVMSHLVIADIKALDNASIAELPHLRH